MPICDHCEEKYSKYNFMARCRDCGDTVCPYCTVSDSDFEDEGRLKCLCLWCADAEAEDAEADVEGWAAQDDDSIKDVDFG